MQNVFIIGSAGKIGLRLVKLLITSDHNVTALYRKPEQYQVLFDCGAKPSLGDITQLSTQTLAEKMRGSDIVVFTAGAGGAGIEITNAVDGLGLKLAVDAAVLAGVQRFILVSVFPEAGRTRETSEQFENYIFVKKQADAYLVSSQLDWLIVRPGRLNDDMGRGTVNAGLAIPYGVISRDDVAATLAEVIEYTGIKHKIIELTEGDTVIEQAIKQIASY